MHRVAIARRAVAGCSEAFSVASPIVDRAVVSYVTILALRCLVLRVFPKDFEVSRAPVCPQPLRKHDRRDGNSGGAVLEPAAFDGLVMAFLPLIKGDCLKFRYDLLELPIVGLPKQGQHSWRQDRVRCHGGVILPSSAQLVEEILPPYARLATLTVLNRLTSLIYVPCGQRPPPQQLPDAVRRFIRRHCDSPCL